MNIIICDDRIDDRKNVSDLLSDYGEKKNYEFTITEYDSGEQLCEDQSALEACQLLFLDINMQGMDGLKTAMRIKEKYPKLLVVLVTAYMNYALDGYKVKASRFLLKDNLADTIEECMDDLIAEINKNRRILEFRFVEGTIKLYADDIIYIETELHKNVFYTEKGTFQIYKKLDELENEFNDIGSCRYGSESAGFTESFFHLIIIRRNITYRILHGGQKCRFCKTGGSFGLTACDIRACDSQGVAFVENRKCLL